MRAVIRKAQGQQQLQPSGEGDVYYTPVSGASIPYLSQLPNYGNGLGGGNSFGGVDFGSMTSRMGNKNCDKADPVDGAANPQTYSVPHTSGYSPGYSSSGSVQTQSQDVYGLGSERGSSNSSILLENILSPPSASPSHPFQQSGKPAANTMLMSMLSDVPSANSNAPFPFLPQNSGKPRKQKKRKGTSECRSPGSSTGRSPKRRATTDDMSTPDAESSDSTSMEVGSSSFSEQANSGRTSIQFDSECVKTEPTGSLDNFLGDGSFLRQGSSTGATAPAPVEHGIGEESPSSVGMEAFSQSKQQYHFSTDPLGFGSNVTSIGNPDARYQHPGGAGNIAAHNTSFDLEGNPSALASKLSSSLERQCRKAKRLKTESDSKVSGNSESSEEDDNDKSETWEPKGSDKIAFQNALNQFGNMVDTVKTSPSRTSPTVMKTSIKIAKNNDSLKISKIDSKTKQKEGRRSSGDAIYSQSRKKDGRKERKRRRAEGSKESEDKPQIKPIHINLSQDASLMPQPSIVDSKVAVSAPTVRPITLNVKPVALVSSGSKSPLTVGKKGSSPTFKSSTKIGFTERGGKNSQLSTKYSDADGRISPSSTKMTFQTSTKVQKHKSGNSKGTSGCVLGQTQAGSITNPNKSPSTKPPTLKLKNLNLPASTTITPVNTKTSPLSSPPIGSASITIIPAPSTPTSGKSLSPNSNSNSSNNNPNGNKTSNKPRKGSLDAVIDKLRVQQSTQPGVPTATPENLGKSEARESKLDRKEAQSRELRERESNLQKGGEGKSKFSSSDQFTIKQSSGIKLTVTKTRSSDNTVKTSSKVKVHQSSEKSTVPPVSHKVATMGASNVKSVPPSKKSSSNPGSVSPTISNSPNSLKTSSTAQKISSPSRGVFPSSCSTKNPNSISSKAAFKSPSSSQTKVPLSKPDRPEKTKSSAPFEMKTPLSTEGKPDKLSGQVVASIMPPPQTKLVGEPGRPSSGNTPKRIEEAVAIRQSPRRTPTHESAMEENDPEKAFRQLLEPLRSVDNQGATDLTVPRIIDSPPWNIETSRGSDVSDSVRDTDKNLWSGSDATRYVEPSAASNHPDEATEREEQEPNYSYSVESCFLINATKPDVVTSKTEVSAVPTMNEDSSQAVVPSFPKPTGPQKSGREEDDSSPEDGLVIDYPSTPRLPKSPERKSAWSSPRTTFPASGHSNVQDKTETPASPVPPTKSPFQISPQIKSPTPVGTPPSNHSLSSSMSRPSPCIIDDDLMDEAVMGLGD